MKKSVYLFNDEFPKGQMFNVTKEEEEKLLEEGWVDTPTRLDLPEEMHTGVTVEQAKEADPTTLVNLVKSYGFMVLTPEQLKAEAVKMASVALDISKFSDEALIAEAEKRGLKEPEITEEDDLLFRFKKEPESLTKEELVKLGNESFKLGLRSNMKEETLIEKIKGEIAKG